MNRHPQRRPQRLGLRWRLLLLNFASASLSVVTFTYISYFYKQSAFLKGLEEAEQINSIGANDRELPVMLRLFRRVNTEGTLMGVAVTSLSVAGMTLWFSRSLNRPLESIEQAVQRFHAGDFAPHLPTSRVPEIERLCVTLSSAAAQIQQTEQRRQVLIGELMHELATPLTVIKGYLELIQADQVAVTPALSEMLVAEAERMERLISDLQTLSKIESGNLSLRLQIFNPQPLIQRTAEAFRSQCQQADQTLDLSGLGILPDLYADPDRFGQILANLLSNAVRYTPPGGTIQLTAYAQRQDLWIAVTDTGIGISEADLPRIFDRFYRTPAARRLQPQGSGLGLAIVKRLVETQGGKLTVANSPQGGCTFRFALPLA